jgi:uncharacterized protein with WD repeat
VLTVGRQTSTMELLDGKGIKVPGLRDYAWSPAESLLAYWIPEQNESPARVSILHMPNRRVVGHKNLFNVADVRAASWRGGGAVSDGSGRRAVQDDLASGGQVFVRARRAAH